MFVSEWIQLIKRTLTDKKHINVSDLSTMLNVSEVTERRDLQKLESINFLNREHGGAIINGYDYTTMDYNHKKYYKRQTLDTIQLHTYKLDVLDGCI